MLRPSKWCGFKFAPILPKYMTLTALVRQQRKLLREIQRERISRNKQGIKDFVSAAMEGNRRLRKAAGGCARTFSINDKQESPVKNKLSKILAIVAVGIFAASVLGRACASEKDDAVSLVEQAAAMMKAEGKEKALAAINDPKGPFVKGTLYMYSHTTSTAPSLRIR